MQVVLLPPLFLPPLAYFEAMRRADMAVIDTSMRHDRRMKAVHRTVVSGNSSPSFLTVPVTPPRGHALWADIRISAHGEWWRVQKATLATLYGPTPFYSLLHHDITALLTADCVGRPVTDLDIDLILAVRRITGITTRLSVTLDSRLAGRRDVTVTDLRRHDFYADPQARSVLETLFAEGLQLFAEGPQMFAERPQLPG